MSEDLMGCKKCATSYGEDTFVSEEDLLHCSGAVLKTIGNEPRQLLVGNCLQDRTSANARTVSTITFFSYNEYSRAELIIDVLAS